MTSRCLPVLNEDGSWIEHPDLMTWAIMALPSGDDHLPLYEMMVIDGQHAPAVGDSPLTEPGRVLHARYFANPSRDQVYAGTFVIEAIGMLQRHGEITKTGVLDRVAAKMARHKPRGGTRASVRRGVEKAVRTYRDVLHLYGAFGLLAMGAKMEMPLERFADFLGIAQNMERTLDRALVGRWTWDPWRIPASDLITVARNPALEGPTQGPHVTVAVRRKR